MHRNRLLGLSNLIQYLYFRRVRKVVTHKQFDKFTYEYDIALLELHGNNIKYQVDIAFYDTGVHHLFYQC